MIFLQIVQHHLYNIPPHIIISQHNKTPPQNIQHPYIYSPNEYCYGVSWVHLLLLNRMIEHINKLFMAVVVFSLFTYFERPDYNLPLFAFIILLWDNVQIKQKTRIWYLMAVSLLVDLIWIIYWAATWGGYKNNEAGLCNFTIFVSVLIFILKIVIIGLTYVKVDDCKKAVSELSSNVKYVFKGPTAGGQEQFE